MDCSGSKGLLISRKWVLLLASTAMLFSVTLRPTDALPLDLVECSECFGPGRLLKGNCSLDSMIAVRESVAGSKLLSQNCSRDAVISSDVDPSCCRTEPLDCLYPYTSRTYFDVCNGRPTCTIPVAPIDTPPSCNASIYSPHNNFLYMHYHCVNTNNIIRFTNNTKIHGAAVYLTNAAYPQSIRPEESDLCTVSSACGTYVKVTAVDLRLACSQALVISTDKNESAALNCSYTSTRGIYHLPVPESSFLRLHLNYSGKVNEGRFWLQFNSSDSAGSVTLACGTAAERPPDCAILTSPTVPEETSFYTIPYETTANTSISANGTTTYTSQSTAAGDIQTESGLTAGGSEFPAWIVPIIILAVALPFIIVGIWYYRNRKRKIHAEPMKIISNQKTGEKPHENSDDIPQPTYNLPLNIAPKDHSHPI